MYNKTTSETYLKYGHIINHFFDDYGYQKKREIIESKTTDVFTSYNEDVIVNVIEGMAILVIMDNEIKLFAIHRMISINRNVKFTILPMSNVALYHIYIPKTASITTHNYPYTFKNITSQIVVREIEAIYYVVKSPSYKFNGERHHLFELTYVDHGKLLTKVEEKTYELTKNTCMIYYPGQFHTQEVITNESCSYITIIFECSGVLHSNLFNRVFSCTRDLVAILETIAKNTDADFKYKNDLLISYLQIFIVKLLQLDELKKVSKPTTLINQHFENTLLEEMINYIYHHLYEPLPVDQICSKFNISRSSLQNLFNNNLNVSPKHYINEQKLALSKVLIKNGEHTISEISAKLGFTSIHYFSRKFTKRYGITPSEYARKIYG